MHEDTLLSFAHQHRSRNQKEDVFLTVLLGLLAKYFERVSDAKKIFDLLQARGDRVLNDHSVFRFIDLKP